MTENRAHRLQLVIGIAFAGWGILLFFESIFFGAAFFGQPVPSWAAWIANLTPLDLNLIDTVFVALVVISIVLAIQSSRHHRRIHSTRGGGSAAGWVLLLVGLVLVFTFLFLATGLTLSNLVSGFRGFLGI